MTKDFIFLVVRSILRPIEWSHEVSCNDSSRYTVMRQPINTADLTTSDLFFVAENKTPYVLRY